MAASITLAARALPRQVSSVVCDGVLRTLAHGFANNCDANVDDTSLSLIDIWYSFTIVLCDGCDVGWWLLVCLVSTAAFTVFVCIFAGDSPSGFGGTPIASDGMRRQVSACLPLYSHLRKLPQYR